MVRDQRKQHWNSANSAHCAHRRQFGPLSQLFQTYSSSRTVFFGSEKQRPPPSPGPPLPQSNWLPLPLTAPEQRTVQPPALPGSTSFPFMAKVEQERGNPFLAGQRVVEIQGAATLTSDPRMSVCLLQSTLFFTTNPRPLWLIPALPFLPPPSHPGGDFPLGRGPTFGF